MIARFVLCLAIVAFPVSALAQADEPRFQLQEVSGGVMRMDRETGAVELCRGDASAGFACETVVAAAGADNSETAKALKAQNEALRAEVAALKATLAQIVELATPAAEATESEPLITSTTRRDINRALEVTDTALRTFRDLFKGLQDLPSGQ